MNYRNERFNKTFGSLDWIIESDRDEENPWISDNGAFVEHLTDHLDTPCDEAERLADEDERRRAVRLAKVMNGLERTGRGYLVPVLRLIAEHGNDRTASIAALAKERGTSYAAAKVLYFRHRKVLMKLLCGRN